MSLFSLITFFFCFNDEAESGDNAGAAAAGPSSRERLQRLDSILNENDDSEIFNYCPSAEERER